LFYLDDERGMQTGSKIKIKIHENLQNGQYKEIKTESPYSVLTMQNINTSRTSQVSIINYDSRNKYKICYRYTCILSIDISIYWYKQQTYLIH